MGHMVKVLLLHMGLEKGRMVSEAILFSSLLEELLKKIGEEYSEGEKFLGLLCT